MDVSLVLTHDCNLGCDYCSAGEKSRRRMSDEVLERALDLAFADESEHVQVSFFGGEPLLEWELVQRAADGAAARARASGKTLQLVVTTNGTLLDDERIAFLVERDAYVGLSIDGVRAAHEATRPTRGGRSSFAAVEGALERLVAHGAWFQTISVVDPRNVRWLGESLRFLVARGVERLTLNPNFHAAWSDDELAAWSRGYEAAAALYVERCLAGAPVYLSVIEDKLIAHVKGGLADEDRCRFGHGAVAVAPSGNLYPCERLVEEDTGALRIGDVFAGLARGRQMVLDAQTGPVNEECTGCGVRERCASFCACANLAETGAIGVAGGVQCWHEQLATRVADAVGAELWRARDPRFLARVYSYGEARCA
jgi:uncharacterized protein